MERDTNKPRVWKRFWGDDVQPCIEKHCFSFLRPDQSMSYWACLNKYCSSLLVASYTKRSLRLLNSGVGLPGSHTLSAFPAVTMATTGCKLHLLNMFLPHPCCYHGKASSRGRHFAEWRQQKMAVGDFLIQIMLTDRNRHICCCIGLSVRG